MKDKNFRYYWEKGAAAGKSPEAVAIDVPGFSKDEIKISVANDTLTIKAEKRRRNVERGKNFYKESRSSSSFVKTFPLPGKNFIVAVKDGAVVVRKKK